MSCTPKASQASLWSLQLHGCFLRHASSQVGIAFLSIPGGSPKPPLRALFPWIVLFPYRHSSSSLTDVLSPLFIVEGDPSWTFLPIGKYAVSATSCQGFQSTLKPLDELIIFFLFPWDSGQYVRENLGNDICYYHRSETHHCWVKMSFVKVINRWSPHVFPQYNIKGRTHHFDQHQRSLV